MNELLFPALNLAVLVGILVYYARTPFRDMVSTRHTSIRDELGAVRTLLSEAQAKHQEFSRRLGALESESAEIRRQVQAEAEETRARLVAEAKKLSTNIVADARTTAENLFGEARSKLLSQFATAVLDRAETLLRERLTGDDRQRIRQEFSRQVEAVQ